MAKNKPPQSQSAPEPEVEQEVPVVTEPEVETPVAPEVPETTETGTPVEPEAPVTTEPEVETEVPAAPPEAGFVFPKFFEGETITVSKSGFAKLYRALLMNKPHSYVGMGAKRIVREVLGAEGEDVQKFHEALREIK